ncbi:Transcription factor [Acorus gramineus]|uniref:Transcription factor n=1 Tax=Acorus gramineus TaxID=55184 RepID=A0AAV9BEW5_ACOGR|nr:Transcription factor [Acorus gramineus]
MPIEVHLRNAASSSAAVARKRKTAAPTPPPAVGNRWRTGAQQRIYGRRLLEAIRSARGESSAAATRPTPPSRIKEAADSALALTAQGRSRWSRAILSRQWRRRRLVVKATAKAAGGKIRRRRWAEKRRLKGKGEAAATKPRKVKERLRVLSRLVPGCRKASTPSLLEEAADYVAALEMQVRAMRALADALSSSSSSAAAAASTSASASAD